jgi:hypothetical protein
MAVADAPVGRRESLHRIVAAIPPASGAVVMATGIVSVSLFLDGRNGPSVILLVIAAVAWVTLGLILAGRLVGDRSRASAEARSPAALTGIAGTAVLGTRLDLLGWEWAGVVLLVIALGLWLGLIGIVLWNWTAPTVGASFILTVSTESLALLAATLALSQRAHWLLTLSLFPFVLGLCFYLFVLSCFDFHQLVIGHGDHWVSGGALAISTIFAGKISIAADGLGMFSSEQGTLKAVALGLWVLTIGWLPVLLVTEALHPRWHYDVRRWSTVFPVGMYAACSFIVGVADDEPPITDFARVWVWVAVSVWLVVLVGMFRRGLHLLRAAPGSPTRINDSPTPQPSSGTGQTDT